VPQLAASQLSVQLTPLLAGSWATVRYEFGRLAAATSVVPFGVTETVIGGGVIGGGGCPVVAGAFIAASAKACLSASVPASTTQSFEVGSCLSGAWESPIKD
jgi:hypothetical protein